MRSWLIRGFIGLLSLGVFAFLVVPTAADSAGSAFVYFSLDPGPTAPGVMGLDDPIPGNCSTWHELWPAFCGSAHQDDYGDNGDGEVSACDNITLNGVVWHIKWAGPTYTLLCDPAGSNPTDVWWEPSIDPHDPASPVCETWEEVYPNNGEQFHIDEWNDADQSGNITPCDEIISGGVLYHVQDIDLNIIVEPPTPTEQGTWGKIKNRFKTLFN